MQNNFKLSGTSLKRLNSVNDTLKLTVLKAIEISEIDFGVACGHRSIEEQYKAYKEGKSKLDGINNKSKHNHFPSLAVDLYAYKNGAASWTMEDLRIVKDAMFKAFEEINPKGCSLRWGGDWDMDGDSTDQTFNDYPHFEIKPIC